MRILQPGTGEIPGDHYLPATPDTVLWGRLPCATDAAVLTVTTGQTVTIDTVSHEGILEDQGKDPVAFFGAHGVSSVDVLDDAIAIASGLSRDPAADGPHVVTGPIRIEGARPGDLLAITVVRLEPRVPYGVISNRHGRGALPGELPRHPGTVSVFAAVQERGGRLHGTLPATEGGERSVAFPLAPFLGTMGVATAEPERPTSIPPAEYGGNIDIKLLVEGTTLYLPVQVDGALAYVGDPHFAQGDGEVALTALEASLRATLRFDVIPRPEALAAFGEVAGPLVRTPEYLVPTGLDLDLGEAMRKCVRAALSLVRARWGLDEHLAYAYLSAATDFDISQVVDIVCGVHARIRQADFAALPAAPLPAAPAPAAPDPAAPAAAADPAAAAASDPAAPRSVAAPPPPSGPSPESGVFADAGRNPADPPVLGKTPDLGNRDVGNRDGGNRDGGNRDAGAGGHRDARDTGNRGGGREDAFDRSVWRSVGDPLLQGAWEGRLAGLTVAVKDLFAISGYRIGAGNPAYLEAARPETTTAPAVADLLRAGASLRGIARTDEFAYSLAGDNPHYGTPPNPALPGGLPGGSSSGPASAVASGHADVGLATDTAGSIRVPASYQGLWGLRTTHGLVPRQGMLPLAQSFDTVGWITRDGETLQRVVDWCLSFDGSESTEWVYGESGADLPWRLLVPPAMLADVEPGTRAAFEALLAALAASDDPPETGASDLGDLDAHLAAFRTVQGAEAWRNNGAWLREHPGTTGPAVAERFRAAAAVTPEDEAAARRELDALRDELAAVVRDAVLVFPTVPGPAPSRTATAADVDAVRSATVRMTAPAAVGGLPAVSVPLLTVPSDLGPAPVGVCLVSRAGTDIALVRFARRLAAAVRDLGTERQ